MSDIAIASVEDMDELDFIETAAATRNPVPTYSRQLDRADGHRITNIVYGDELERVVMETAGA